MCGVCVWVLVQPTKARRRRAPGRTTAARTTAGARWTRGRRPRTGRASTQELGKARCATDQRRSMGKESAAPCVRRRADRSEARSACHASLQYHRTPQPARVTVSVRRSRPPTAHRRAAGGPAATRQRPPHPSRTGVQRGGFLAVATHNKLAEISTNLRRGRPETTTVHICIL